MLYQALGEALGVWESVAQPLPATDTGRRTLQERKTSGCLFFCPMYWTSHVDEIALT